MQIFFEVKFNRAKYWSRMPLLSLERWAIDVEGGCKRGASITEQWASCSAFRCGERVDRNPSVTQWSQPMKGAALSSTHSPCGDHFTVWRRPLNKQTKAQPAWLGHPPQKRNGNGEHRTHTEMDAAINFEPPGSSGAPLDRLFGDANQKGTAPKKNKK